MAGHPICADWRVAEPPLVLDRAIRFADGHTVPFARVERASVLLEDGRPRCLHRAVADGRWDPADPARYGDYLGWRGSWNIGIPLADTGEREPQPVCAPETMP